MGLRMIVWMVGGFEKPIDFRAHPSSAHNDRRVEGLHFTFSPEFSVVSNFEPDYLDLPFSSHDPLEAKTFPKLFYIDLVAAKSFWASIKRLARRRKRQRATTDPQCFSDVVLDSCNAPGNSLSSTWTLILAALAIDGLHV